MLGVSVEQTIIILVHFTECIRWSNPEYNPLLYRWKPS